MKRIFAPITSFFTLILGIWVVGLISLWAPLPELNWKVELTPTLINPCALNSRSEAFLNKDIVVQATLYQVDNPIIVYPNIYFDGFPVRDCGVSAAARAYFSAPFDPSIWTTLDLREYIGPNSELPLLFQNERAHWEIDAEVEGVLYKNAHSEY